MSRPNLLFVFADQWRRQALGCMNSDPVLTPRMDAFAAQGTVFENAFSCNPVCTPNRAAILTGKHPFSIGMMYNWLRLPVREETFASLLRERGYDTGYVGKWHLDEWDGDPEHGDAWNAYTPAGPRRMGFDFWYSNGCVHAHWVLKYMRTDNSVFEGEGWQPDHETGVALDYIRNTHGQRDGEKPFCLFVSWSPPHTNHGGPHFRQGVDGYQYGAPEEYEELYRDADLPVPPNTEKDVFRMHAPGYFGAVSSLDHNFGRLLDCLEEEGLADDTVVVLTADHGEMLGSHGQLIKDVWFEESVGIPFVIRWPGHVPAGLRQSMLFNTPDMLPSVLSLMGCPVPDDVQGRDLSLAMKGESQEGPDAVFLSFNGGAPPDELVQWKGVFPDEGNRKWRAVRTRQWLYVAAARDQYGDVSRFRPALPAGVKSVLYDLENDPWQVCPIYRRQGHDDVMDELRARLDEWLRDMGDPFLERDWV